MKKIRVSQLSALIIVFYLISLIFAIKFKTDIGDFGTSFYYCTAISVCLSVLMYMNRRIRQVQMKDLGYGAMGFGLCVLIKYTGLSPMVFTFIPTVIFICLVSYSLYKDKDDATLIVNATMVNEDIVEVMRKLNKLQDLAVVCDEAGLTAAATRAYEIKRQETENVNRAIAPYMKELGKGQPVPASMVNRDRPTAVKVVIELYKSDTVLTSEINELVDFLNKAGVKDRRKTSSQQGEKREEHREEKKSSALNVESFFAGCNTKEEYKKRFAALAKTYHPDSGYGDADIYMMIKEYYDSVVRK